MVIKRQSNILIKLGVLKTKQAASDRTEYTDCVPVNSAHYKYCQLGACLPKSSSSCCQFCSVRSACSGVCASVVKPKKVMRKRKLKTNDTGTGTIGPIWRDL